MKLAELDEDWEVYEADGEGYIPMDRWGKDHWSTLAYAETCIVDYGGILDNRRLRVNARLHREFAANAHLGNTTDYPTWLKGGITEAKHDDISCLEDMVAAGVIIAETRRVNWYAVVNNSQIRVRLTDKGQAIAEQLRRHKATGGNFAGFEVQQTEVQ